MRRMIVLLVTLMPATVVLANETAPAASQNETAIRSAYSCILSPQNLFKYTSPGSAEMPVIPFDEAMINPNCPKLRDYTAVRAAYTSRQNTNSEKLFLEGIADSCLIDLQRVGQEPTSDMRTGDSEKRFMICSSQVFRNCREDFEKVSSALAERIQYITDEGAKEFFPWNAVEEERFSRLTAIKLCSGAISLETFKKLDAYVISNTQCSGDLSFPKHKDLAEYGPILETNSCEHGANGTIKLEVTKEAGRKSRYSVRSIILNGSNRNFTRSYKDGKTISGFDDTMIHEFAHLRKAVEPLFAAKAKKFTDIRYKKVATIGKKIASDYETTFNKVSDRLERDLTLSNYERTKLFHKELSRISEDLDRKAKEAKIPTHFGVGYEGDAIIYGSPIKAGSVVLGSGPLLIGNTEEELATNGRGFDTYSLTSKEEYLAEAISLYRYDRRAAVKVYTREELKWLAENSEEDSGIPLTAGDRTSPTQIP